MGFELHHNQPIIRSYDRRVDRARVEELERRCEVGPAERVFFFTDTLGDPICRIRNSPMYKMLVAEMDNELVGVIQGSIKLVTINKEIAKVGYILGLRVAPHQRRKGIGSSLVHDLEEWFLDNEVDYAYMATQKDNEPSVKLFVEKFGYKKFRTPAILVNPVQKHRPQHISPAVEIVKLKIEDAESLYRKFMSSAEFFPNDIEKVLRNKLSLGTWVAYPRGESWGSTTNTTNKSWAMLSVWNTGGLFKLWLGKAPLKFLIYSKSTRVISRFFPCLYKLLPWIPDFYNPFGFYFIYGVHCQGPLSGKLVRTLCQFVHNMAIASKDCKVVVTEVGGHDQLLRQHIPHWKKLFCPEDLWCIKPFITNDHHHHHHDRGNYDLINQPNQNVLYELITKNPPSNKTLFVDPREV